MEAVPYSTTMFTGLVEDVGEVSSAQRGSGGLRLTVQPRQLPITELVLGESVAVDGACFTVVQVQGRAFSVDVGPESLQRTVCADYLSGRTVNLERSLKVGARLGGHFVLGHVDAVGRVRAVTPRGDALDLTIEAPAEVLNLTPPKGSVAIDGVSLTVNTVDMSTFQVSLIPHTVAHTTLGSLRPGRAVNLETDILARTVAWLMSRGVASSGPTGVTMDLLRSSGFA